MEYELSNYRVEELPSPIEVVVNVSSYGRITIDRNIIELLGLRKGDKIKLKITTVFRRNSGGD